MNNVSMFYIWTEGAVRFAGLPPLRLTICTNPIKALSPLSSRCPYFVCPPMAPGILYGHFKLSTVTLLITMSHHIVILRQSGCGCFFNSQLKRFIMMIFIRSQESRDLAWKWGVRSQWECGYEQGYALWIHLIWRKGLCEAVCLCMWCTHIKKTGNKSPPQKRHKGWGDEERDRPREGMR